MASSSSRGNQSWESLATHSSTNRCVLLMIHLCDMIMGRKNNNNKIKKNSNILTIRLRETMEVSKRVVDKENFKAKKMSFRNTAIHWFSTRNTVFFTHGLYVGSSILTYYNKKVYTVWHNLHWIPRRILQNSMQICHLLILSNKQNCRTKDSNKMNFIKSIPT